MDNIKNIVEVNINSIEIFLAAEKKVLLKDVKFNVSNNSIYAIVGQNGVGKTTLLKSILNLLEKKFYKVDGTILVNQQNVLECPEDELINIRKHTAKYIFQDSINSFDPLKKLEYYFPPTGLASEILDELLDYFLLPSKNIILRHYPYELSGGMAQRLAIIWGLISNPQLLLLDEPNSSLDIPISNLLSNKLKQIKESGKTSIVFVTQDLDFAINTADKIGILSCKGISEFSCSDENINRVKSDILKQII